jgi:hypothetical protein
MTAHPSSAAYPDRALEWLFTALMLGWGVWLLAPWWDTFRNPQYAVLALLAPEQVWGVWSVAIGAIRAAALYINGSHRRTPLVRCICAALGVIWWLTLIWLFLLAPQRDPPAGYAFYAIFVVGELVACWRCAADAWHSGAFRIRGGERRA